MSVTVLVGGSKGRRGVVERRYKNKYGVWYLEVRLDATTVCIGPESDFQYDNSYGDDIE